MEPKLPPLPAFHSAQTTAWLLAHRAVLTFLVAKLMAGDPDEAAARDDTATMLRNSMPPLFAHLPEPVRQQMAELAGMEIDRILLPRFADLPPDDQPG